MELAFVWAMVFAKIVFVDGKTALAAVLAVFLLGYLGVALLKPEKFS